MSGNWSNSCFIGVGTENRLRDDGCLLILLAEALSSSGRDIMAIRGDAGDDVAKS